MPQFLRLLHLRLFRAQTCIHCGKHYRIPWRELFVEDFYFCSQHCSRGYSEALKEWIYEKERRPCVPAA